MGCHRRIGLRTAQELRVGLNYERSKCTNGVCSPRGVELLWRGRIWGESLLCCVSRILLWLCLTMWVLLDVFGLVFFFLFVQWLPFLEALPDDGLGM